jgi:sugar transport system substrate-binding protein
VSPMRLMERHGIVGKGAIGAAVVGWVAVLACGCSGPDPEEAGKKQIAAILFQEDQFFRLVEFGMEDAAEKHGVELLAGNSHNSLDKEISLVDTYVARGVDALVVAPLSAEASIAALKRAHDRGIPVVTYDSYIKDEFPVSNVRSDQIQLGASTGAVARQYVLDKLGGKAKVAMIEYISFAPEPAAQRVKGFRDEIVKAPEIEIVAEQDAWLGPQATDVVASLLTAHPDVNLIWAANEGGTVGAVTAVRAAGKAGKVAVFGTDMSEQIGDFLLADDNVLQAVTGQKPHDIGFMAVEAAVKALKGEAVDRQVALSGMLFTRERPEEIREYVKFLEQMSR